MTHQQQPLPLEYETPQPQKEWWRYVRIALIVWSAIGIFQFLGGLTFGFQRRGIYLIPSAINCIACVSLLLGAISSFSLGSRNTALTIGAATLPLYTVVATYFGGSMRNNYLPALLIAFEHVWFPIVLVVMKIRSSGAAYVTSSNDLEDDAIHAPPKHEDRSSQIDLSNLGSPLQLLWASQVPGFFGMLLVAALVCGLIKPGFYGSTAILILLTTVAGSILSCALSLAFLRTPCRTLARRLAKVHLAYLIGFVVICGLLFVTSK